MKPSILKGKVWILRDSDNKMINNIDTDMIFHNKYLHITNINEMGQYALDNLEGWTDFSKKAEPGDILVVGENFGAGSSRQQAVDCFISLGIQALIGESFGAIYKRNTINAGLPLIESPHIGGMEGDKLKMENGNEVEIDLLNGTILNKTTGKSYKANPLPEVVYEIYQNGGVFEYAKKF